MKKTTLLITLFVTFLSFSQESRLTIFSEDGEPFYVILNGEDRKHKSWGVPFVAGAYGGCQRPAFPWFV